MSRRYEGVAVSATWLLSSLEVVCISRRTGRSRAEVVGLLVGLWGWVGDYSIDGNVRGASVWMLPQAVGGDADFWSAVAEVGLIKDRGDDLWAALPKRITVRAKRASLHTVGTIYFIRASESGHIKIGFTAGDVEARRSFLQTSHSAPLILEATAPGTQTDERALHARFAAVRLSGEWFEETEELAAYIEYVRHGGQL